MESDYDFDNDPIGLNPLHQPAAVVANAQDAEPVDEVPQQHKRLTLQDAQARIDALRQGAARTDSNEVAVVQDVVHWAEKKGKSPGVVEVAVAEAYRRGREDATKPSVRMMDRMVGRKPNRAMS